MLGLLKQGMFTNILIPDFSNIRELQPVWVCTGGRVSRDGSLYWTVGSSAPIIISSVGSMIRDNRISSRSGENPTSSISSIQQVNQNQIPRRL